MFSFIEKFLKPYIDEKINQYLQKEEDIKKKEKIQFNNSQKEYYIDKVVILRSNEWNDLIIGPVIDFIEKNDDLIFIVYDLISGEEVFSNGIMREYHKDLFSLLIEHNPYEQWLLMSKSGPGKLMDKPKIQTNLLSKEDYSEVTSS